MQPDELVLAASMIPIAFVCAVAFAFGAVFGSFANVVIYRWPNELSIVSPGSHCFSCNAPVAWYDNVPIVSWFVLRGRCRHCKAPFSIRYPMVELLYALVATAIAYEVFRHHAYLNASAAAIHVVLRVAIAFVLMTVAFIDYDAVIVPDWVMYWSALPLAASVVYQLAPHFLPQILPLVTWDKSLAGAAIGFLGIRILFVEGMKLLTQRAGMGKGDASVMLLVGAAFGPPGVFFTLGAGAVQGTVAWVALRALGKRFGPAWTDEVSDDDEEEDEDAQDTPPPETPAAGTPAPADPETPTVSTPDATAAPAGDTPPAEPEAHPAAESAPVPPPGLGSKLPFVPFLTLAAVEYMLGGYDVVREFLVP